MDPLTKGILIGLAVGVLVGLLIGRVLFGGRGRSAGPRSGKPIDNEFARLLGGQDPIASSQGSDASLGEVAQLRQDLRAKFLHDEGRINDAIEVERERNPNGSEVDLLKAAIYRWERDNR